MQSVVTFNGAEPFEYRLALGRVCAGRHRVSVSFDAAKSPPGVMGAEVERLRASMAPAGDLVARYAPSHDRVTSLNRGFLLGQDLVPQPSFVPWSGSETLTPSRPEAVIWQAP